MNIDGTYTLQAPPERVWQCLLDQHVLRQIVPGIERIEQIDQDSYTITVHYKHSPLKGTYQGRLSLTEQQYPYHYHITVAGEGSQESINGAGDVHLHRHNETTVITYKGTLNIGKVTRVKPTLIKGATKLLIQRFFTALADQLHTDHDQQASTTIQSENLFPVAQSGKAVTILPGQTDEPATRSRGIFRTITHLFKPRTGTSLQKNAQGRPWQRQLRRYSALSALLFLVWLGTRIPSYFLPTGRKKGLVVDNPPVQTIVRETKRNTTHQ